MDLAPAPVAALAAHLPLTAAVAPNPAEVHLLAATTWAEARSEGEEGMRAVAHVIVNRVGPRFGEDISTVVLAPKQFSSWNLHDPNRPLAQNPERYATGGVNLVVKIVASPFRQSEGSSRSCENDARSHVAISEATAPPVGS